MSGALQAVFQNLRSFSVPGPIALKYLFAWGVNNVGQLGDGTTVDKSSPVQIGSSSWTAISTGRLSGHTLAIDSNGLLFAWGAGTSGALGDGTTVSKSSPVQIGSSSWTAVSAGYAYSMAIRSDGKLFTWGYVGSGALGDGQTISNRSSPVQIGSSSWTAISAGREAQNPVSIAIRSGGTLFTWGTGLTGQLGLFDTDTGLNRTAVSDFTVVGRGVISVAAIKDDGTLWFWGSNPVAGGGAIPDPSTYGTNISAPLQLRVGAHSSSSWTAVQLGLSTGVAIRSGGTLFSWGLRPGDGTAVAKSSPVQIGSSSWTAVSAGSDHIHAIRSGGTLFGWGTNVNGTIGDNSITVRSSPVQIGSSTWTAVSDGSHACAIRSDGLLFCWGLNTFGQLGNGNVSTRSSPVQIGSSTWTAVSCGGNHTLAIRSDGKLFAWGLGTSGQLGDGTILSKSSPVQIGSSSWTAVAATNVANFSFAIRSDGMLFSWGAGTSGGLGDGTAVTKSSPVQIGSSSWTAVSARNGGAHAIKSGGVLYAWGLNTAGAIGDSTLTTKSSPTAMGNNLALQQFSPVQVGSSSWTAVSSGFSHTAAIRSGGTLFTWGNGGGGALGDGTTVSKSSPVQIGSSSWTAVSLGGTGSDLANTVAIRSGGTLFAWGYNGYGQIGDGTAVNKSSPVQIGSSSWTAVSAGEIQIAAIRSGGTLFTWGAGTSGQLGNGTTVARSSPVQIGSSSWTAVSAGVSYTMGILS